MVGTPKKALEGSDTNLGLFNIIKCFYFLIRPYFRGKGKNRGKFSFLVKDLFSFSSFRAYLIWVGCLTWFVWGVAVENERFSFFGVTICF